MLDNLYTEHSYIVGLDNGIGATGIALFGPENLIRYEKLPTRSELNYQKDEQHITRLDVPRFKRLLESWNLPPDLTIVVMERPMINATRFKASMSACRCWEATLIVLEDLKLTYEIIDSKNWQHVLLPGIEGSDELKAASLKLGQQMFPQFKLKKDADSLMIGYWAKNRALLEKPKPKAKPKKEL